MVRTPKLQQVGRAYSEMSPLNPPTSPNSGPTTSSGRERHDSGGYGSIFPFGFFRSSFGRSNNSVQVGVFDTLASSRPYVLTYQISKETWVN